MLIVSHVQCKSVFTLPTLLLVYTKFEILNQQNIQKMNIKRYIAFDTGQQD